MKITSQWYTDAAETLNGIAGSLESIEGLLRASVKPGSATVREFINLPPAKTRCPISGLSRSTMYVLCVPCAANRFRPKVPAKLLRKHGNTRGTWLIVHAKLLDYLHSLPETREEVEGLVLRRVKSRPSAPR